jgi:hypothetical protein
MEFVVSPDPLIEIVLGSPEPQQEQLQLIEAIFVEQPDCPPYGESFEDRSHLEELEDIHRVQLCDNCAPIGAYRQQSLAVELPYGLAHGHPAQAELSRDLFGLDSGAAGQPPIPDLLPQISVSLREG